jgi:hypothetical protein
MEEYIPIKYGFFFEDVDTTDHGHERLFEGKFFYTGTDGVYAVDYLHPMGWCTKTVHALPVSRVKAILKRAGKKKSINTLGKTLYAM